MRIFFFFLFLTVAWAEISDYPPSIEEGDILSQTTHEITLESGPLVYTATVGSIPAREKNGRTLAHLFYISYHKEGVSDPSTRPITFAFNGGPGACSVWIHLGAFGPKRTLSVEEGQTPTPPYRWIENVDTILDLTDLVFIDPVGTGFSRPVSEDDGSLFYSIDGDICSMGDFICDYVTKENRWTSPKYLAGESYGTFRACGLSEYLLNEYALYLNGLILISSAIDFQTLLPSLDNELPYALFLPSFAATAWYHRRLDPMLSLEEVVTSARQFSFDSLGTSLLKQGSVPSSLYPDLSYWTGLPLSTIEHCNGLISDTAYFIQLFASEKKVIGRFDSRFLGDIFPPRNESCYRDPSGAKTTGIFIGAMHAYLRDELNCKLDWPRYRPLAFEANLAWDFTTFGYPAMMESLRNCLVENPDMRLFAACGYFDLATPFAATEYSLKRLRLPLEKNITFGYYEGGHMFYTNPSALKKFKRDLSQFFQLPSH